MRTAILLAGGDSTRMKPDYTFNKALLMIGKKSLLTYQMEWLASHGFDHFIVATNDDIYSRWIAKEQNLTHLKTIEVSIESTKLGTSGAVLQATNDYVVDSKVYIMNVDDILMKYSPSLMYEKLNGGGVIALSKPRIGFGLVRLKNGLVTRFQEKPTIKFWVSAGHYAFNVDTIKSYFTKKGDLEKEVFPILAKDRLLNGYKIKDNWHTINTYKDYIEFCRILNIEPTYPN